MKIGTKIKALRIQNNLTQEELANRAELSKGFISQIERDLTSPSIATLVDILQCLGSDLKNFFHDTEDTQVVFSPNDYFENQNLEHKHRIQWVIPNAQKNTMEPILVTLSPFGSTLTYPPHSGENFGYVLKGSMTLYLGTDRYRIKKGESFYFEAKKEFSLHNDSKQEAELLLVSSPPNF